MWRRRYSCATSTVSIGGKHAIYTGTTLPTVAFSRGDHGGPRAAAAGDTLYKNVDYATSNNFAKSMPNHLNRIDGVFDGTSSGF